MTGKYNVVELEHSDISTAQAEAHGATTGEFKPELLFCAVNIANHRKVASFEENPTFYIARKKIPHVVWRVDQPETKSMKLELVSIDVFSNTEGFVVVVVARVEFSPLKNAPGTGTNDPRGPKTGRRDFLAQDRRFLEESGAAVREGIEIELPLLVTYACEREETNGTRA